MNRYKTSSEQSVMAENMNEAAKLFANRKARRKYGDRGYCRTCTPGAYMSDGSLCEYSAFIGYTTGQNETTGHNINFTVRLLHEESARDGSFEEQETRLGAISRDVANENAPEIY